MTTPRLARSSLLIACLLALATACSSPPTEGMPPDPAAPDMAEELCSCTVGTRRCQGTSVEICEPGPASCAAWGPKVPCPTGVCSDGSCGGGCQDKCSAGAARCAGTMATEVCRIGASGCLEWVQQACPAQQACDPASGICSPMVPCEACPTGYMCDRSGVCVGGDPTMWILDVKTVVLSGKLTKNGADPVNGADCARRPSADKARVVLTENSKGYRFTLPLSCSSTGFDFSGTIYPGTYRVLVSGIADAGSNYSNLPSVAYEAESAMVIGAVGMVSGKVFDVKTVQAAGKVTRNGADAKNSAECMRRPSADKALVSFTESTKGYAFTLPLLCSETSFQFAGSIYPGTYRITVQGAANGLARYSDLPTAAYVTDSALSIPADLSGKVLDVKTAQVAGKVTINSADPVVSAECMRKPSAEKARVTFSDASKGYSFALPISCSDTGFPFSGEIYPGTFRVTVEGLSSGGTPFSNLPSQDFIADSALAVSADVSGKVLDVKTAQVAGKVLLNGVDPVNSADCLRRPSAEKARVVFSETSKGYTFTLPLSCSDRGFPFSGVVYPGTYRVTAFGVAEAGARYSDLPTENFIAEAALAVTADVSGKVLDVKTVEVGGKLTLNGADPVNGADCMRRPSAEKVRVVYSEPTRGYTFTLPMLCADTAFAFAGTVYPGTYRVSVAGITDGGSQYSNLPAQAFIANAALALTGDLKGQVLAVKTVRVGGKVTLNSADPKNNSPCMRRPSADKARVSARELALGYRFDLPMACSDTTFTFSGIVYPGTYQLSVAGLSDGGTLYSDLPGEDSVAITRVIVP